MRKKLLLFVTLFCVCRFNAVSQDIKDDDGTLTTKGLQIHVGYALPLGDFANDDIPKPAGTSLSPNGESDIANGKGHAVNGLNLGLKYYAKLPAQNLFLVVGLDGNRSAISEPYQDNIKDRAIAEAMEPVSGGGLGLSGTEAGSIALDGGAFGVSHLNAAFIVGPCYRYSFNRAVALFGEVNLGVNMSIISDIGLMGGGQGAKYYDKTISYDTGYGFTYSATVGILFVNTFSINLKYNGLGSYEYAGSIKGGEGMTNPPATVDCSSTKALPVSYFTIALGIKF
jgi:hypothetical protein